MLRNKDDFSRFSYAVTDRLFGADASFIFSSPLSKWPVERTIKGYLFWLRSVYSFFSLFLSFTYIFLWGIHRSFYAHRSIFLLSWRSKEIFDNLVEKFLMRRNFFFVYRVIHNSWSNWFFFFLRIEIRLIKKNRTIGEMHSTFMNLFISIRKLNKFTRIWKTLRQFRYFHSYHEFHLVSLHVWTRNERFYLLWNVSGSIFIL